MNIKRTTVRNDDSSTFMTPVKQPFFNNSNHLITTPMVVLDKFRLNNDSLMSPQLILPPEIQRLFTDGKTNFSFSVKEREYNFRVEGSPLANRSRSRTPMSSQQKAIACMDGSDTDDENNNDNTEFANIVSQLKNSSSDFASVDLTLEDDEEEEYDKPKKEIMDNRETLVNVIPNNKTEVARKKSTVKSSSHDSFKNFDFGKSTQIFNKTIDENKKSHANVLAQNQTKKEKVQVAQGSPTGHRNEVPKPTTLKNSQKLTFLDLTPEMDEQIERKLAETKTRKERRNAVKQIENAVSTASNENDSQKRATQKSLKNTSTKTVGLDEREKFHAKTARLVKREPSDDKLQQNKREPHKSEKHVKSSKSSETPDRIHNSVTKPITKYSEESSDEDILFEHLSNRSLENITNKKSSDSDTEDEDDVFFRRIQPYQRIVKTGKISQFCRKRSSKASVDSSPSKIRK